MYPGSRLAEVGHRGILIVCLDHHGSPCVTLLNLASVAIDASMLLKLLVVIIAVPCPTVGFRTLATLLTAELGQRLSEPR